MADGKPLWPRLSDIRISFDLIANSSSTMILSDTAFRALTLLVAYSAGGLVWTYTEPGDGSLPADDRLLARLSGLSLGRWRKVRKEVEPYFTTRKGRWHLNEEWIAVDDRPVRFAIPQEVQRTVLTREGRVCTYCGDTGGPFDFDHILPVSRGGGNEPSNLTLACYRCNRSKGGRTLREWMERL